jgi:transglutaminase-like putative cysteine protease
MRPATDPSATRWQRLRAWLQPQVSIGKREQRDQVVLLLAVAVAALPHFAHLPLWSIAALGTLWIWRAWLAQSLRPAPGRPVVLALLALLATGVWIEHGSLWGREASAHFLLMLLGLKILEMRARRDVFVIVFLCLFVLETQFLFDQGPFTALDMLLSVGLLFFVLLGVSLPVGDISIRSKLRTLARIFLLAMPLALAMFFLFPRLPAPLWSQPAGGGEARGGLSDTMRPGSIRALLNDDAIALRAQFEGPIPAQSQLYWRGPVFGYFDGESWLPLESEPQPMDPSQVRIDVRSGVDYTVTLEPTMRRELLGIELTTVVEGVPAIQGRMTSTMQLRSLTPVTARRRYSAHSYTAFTVESGASPETLTDWLQLPEGSNPRAREWAAQIREQVQSAQAGGQATDRQLADAVLRHFRRDSFRYDLSSGVPPGKDAIDRFLFDSRTGYCEHYASAFVFLMRAMQVPARVVTGYQGGEINPVDGFLTVRQSDAHAWAEVWLARRGWVRFDPTAAVAPERVERSREGTGAEDAYAAGERSGWLHRWRLNREALENAWNQWVLSYSAERQRALVDRLGLRPNVYNVALVAALAIAALLAMLTAFSLRRPAARDPLADIVGRLRRKLLNAGIVVAPSMGLRDLEEHLSRLLEPASMQQARELLRDLGAARYGPASRRVRASELARLRAQLRRWRVARLAA